MWQVIYATEPIDEPCLLSLEKFGEYAIVDVSREGLDLGVDDADKKKVSIAPQLLLVVYGLSTSRRSGKTAGNLGPSPAILSSFKASQIEGSLKPRGRSQESSFLSSQPRRKSHRTHQPLVFADTLFLHLASTWILTALTPREGLPPFRLQPKLS